MDKFRHKEMNASGHTPMMQQFFSPVRNRVPSPGFSTRDLGLIAVNS